VTNIQQVINEFAKKYKFDSEYGYIEGISRKVPWTDFAPWIYRLNPYAGQETFYQQAMLPYLVFDLKGNPPNKQ
jgi:hypothetical protein